MGINDVDVKSFVDELTSSFDKMNDRMYDRNIKHLAEMDKELKSNIAFSGIEDKKEIYKKLEEKMFSNLDKIAKSQAEEIVNKTINKFGSTQSKMNLNKKTKNDLMNDANVMQLKFLEAGKEVDFDVILDKLTNIQKESIEASAKFNTSMKDALKKMFDSTMALYETVQSTRTETGYLVSQYGSLESTTASLVAENLKWGASSENIQLSIKELTETYGSMRGMNKNLLSDMVKLNGQFGISTDALAKTALYLESAGMSANDMKNYVTDTVLAISKEDGTSLKQNMSAIANASEDVLAFMGSTPKELAKAVSYASKLKLEISDMASMANGLLSIESSIENQMKANVLTGKNMNFEKARELSLQGDLKGANEIVMDQVGSLVDFQKMNVFQQKAIAEATGYSIKQLRTSLTLREKEYNMTEKQRNSQETILTGITQLKNIWTGFKNLIMVPLIPIFESLNQLMSAFTSDANSDIWKNFGKTIIWTLETLATPIAALINGVTALVKLFSGAKGAFSDFGNFLGNNFGKIIIGTILLLVLKFKLLNSTISSMVTGIFKFAGKGIKSLMGSIGEGFKKMGDGVKLLSFSSIAKIGLMAISLTALAFSFKLFAQGGWKGAGVFASAMAISFASILAFSTLASTPFGWLGVAIVTAFGVAVGVLSLAMLGMGKASQMFSGAFSSFSSSLLSIKEVFSDGDSPFAQMAKDFKVLKSPMHEINKEFTQLATSINTIGNINKNISLSSSGKNVDFSVSSNTNNKDAKSSTDTIANLLTKLINITENKNTDIYLDGVKVTKVISNTTKNTRRMGMR